MGEKKYAEAEPLVLSGYQGMKERESKMPMGAKAFLKEDADRAVQLSLGVQLGKDACELLRLPGLAVPCEKCSAEHGAHEFSLLTAFPVPALRPQPGDWYLETGSTLSR